MRTLIRAEKRLPQQLIQIRLGHRQCRRPIWVEQGFRQRGPVLRWYLAPRASPPHRQKPLLPRPRAPRYSGSMERIALPPPFGRLAEIGGVLDVAVFRDARGTQDEIAAAIAQTLPWTGPFDGARLLALGGRRIDRAAFLGDWVDARGRLLRRGSWTAQDGRRFEDPPLRALEGVTIVSGGAPLPEPGAGGQFGYALSCPPYRLAASPRETQALFEEIRALLLPEGQPVEILDWSHPALAEVSGYFTAGLEWWGVFLFSVYVPISRRLTILAASATD